MQTISGLAYVYTQAVPHHTLIGLIGEYHGAAYTCTWFTSVLNANKDNFLVE
jgi:hypothetical protein